MLYFTVPLVSRILPSDICKIYKRGSSIRLDTTLLDFNDMKWERGDISFIFNGQHLHHPQIGASGSGNNNHSPLVVMDNKLKVYQLVTHQVSNERITINNGERRSGQLKQS